ncbi:MAG: hypothetical protein CVU57_01125 [Deltaproteobacteria bacterium HGW-Deltaproteobacteria-15]|jgi:hypothetical protein|nr:MAG: hypothetical protein CVU57_01125 [Deltaproteobacteria bacterium HGW-Deltaproteobacteria-15]
MIESCLQVQIDASAHLIASRIIRDEACQVGLSHLIQLEEYIESLILYDRVVLPVKSGHEERIADEAPQLIWHGGSLLAETIPDLDDRMQKAKTKCLQLACSQNLGEELNDADSTEEWRLGRFAKAVLRSFPGREREFQEHIPMALQLAGTNEILQKDFSSPEYAALSDADKIAIWYLTRTFCFVPIAVEQKRPYKHNYYRATFAQAAYTEARKSLLQSPDLAGYAPQACEINALAASRQTVPLFLAHILEHIDNRNQLENAVMCLRESDGAQRLREHHRELIAEYGEEQGQVSFDRKVERLFSAWRSIGSSIAVPFIVDLPLMPTSIPGSWVWHARSLYYRVTNHAFRIYVDMLDANAIKAFLKNARKVFGKSLL